MWPWVLLIALLWRDEAKPEAPLPGPGPNKPKPSGGLLGPKDEAHPFGANAGPILGENNIVAAEGGWVSAPFDMVVLSGTDKDLWPGLLTQVPAETRAAIVAAQERIASDGPGPKLSNLASRVKGAGDIQHMANVLGKPVSRRDFVAYHLWLAAMQDGLHVAGMLSQWPSGVEEMSVLAVAQQVADATVSDPDLVTMPQKS